MRKKTKISTLATFIQHHIERRSYSNQTRKIKRIQIKKEVKLSLFVGDMILYIENPINTTKKLLELINDFRNFAGYKINIHKFVTFLYTNNEQSEREIKKIIPFTLHKKE